MMSLGIFSVVPPTVPCALRSTQPLKVRTRDFSCGKGGRCVWLTTYHPCSAETSRKSGALIYPEPLGPPRPVAGRLYFNYYYGYCIVCVCCVRARVFFLKLTISLQTLDMSDINSQLQSIGVPLLVDLTTISLICYNNVTTQN